MGKTRIIAETGAGQHGVATYCCCSIKYGMKFYGKKDTERQALNVFRMELLGAKVHTVTSGTMTLKDAVNETFRDWILEFSIHIMLLVQQWVTSFSNDCS